MIGILEKVHTINLIMKIILKIIGIEEVGTMTEVIEDFVEIEEAMMEIEKIEVFEAIEEIGEIEETEEIEEIKEIGEVEEIMEIEEIDKVIMINLTIADNLEIHMTAQTKTMIKVFKVEK